MSTTPHPTSPAPAGATPANPVLAPFEKASAEEAGRFHNYIGHHIPWYVRLLWLIFWVGAAWYTLRLLLPALNTELLSPP
ncbi:MAG: hypothetical protein U0794_12180 [Isosphaeraceae bacterium]